VRSVLEEWFTRYPDSSKPDLERRFHYDFEVCFFELLLYELLLRFHYKVEVEPKLPPPLRKRLDFRAKDEARNTLYLETIVVTGKSKKEKGKDRLLATLYDQINQLRVPDYFLEIIAIRNPENRQPSGDRFKEFVRECVESLDYDKVLELSRQGSLDHLPTWTYKEPNSELEIEFEVIPVSPENRGKVDQRPIGIYPGEFRLDNSVDAIRENIKNKASRYGRLDAPYLIALNCGLATTKEAEIDALFGKKGLFRPDLHTRVSGVVIFKVLPWNLPKAYVCLYHNPEPEHRYSGPLTQLPQVFAGQGRLKQLPGTSLGSILSLPEDWPGKLFDP